MHYAVDQDDDKTTRALVAQYEKNGTIELELSKPDNYDNTPFWYAKELSKVEGILNGARIRLDAALAEEKELEAKRIADLEKKPGKKLQLR